MPEITDIAKEISEDGTDSSQDDIGTVEEMPEDTILSRQTSVNLIPFIGQRFVSQDAAYEFYCSFAKQCGFSIRRHRTRGKDGVGRGITRRDFTCHRGGYPQLKPSEDGKLQRNRKSSRCGCQAFMRIVKREDLNVPEWRITGFSNVHNHELLKSTEMQLIPAYCTMSPDDKSRICMFAKAGMSVRQMLRLMELEKGVKLGCLPFTEVDVRNLLQSYRNVDQDNDPIDLLKMCKEMKDKDPKFKYDYKIDSNNRLEHIAWSYASSMRLYEAFGDAIAFDTTHRLNAYDMLLGIWIGVDNHGSHCFFGCALLRDENVQSFSWALKTFLGFMNGKAPGTILTDQNLWLKEAIAIEIPRVKHAFCIWNIMSRFTDWFSTLLGTQYDDWKAEFHRLYNLHSIEEYEVGWNEMVKTYQLDRNKHIASLYALRSYWALPFLRSFFFAGMTSTFQSETINTYIQRFLSAQSVLDNFVEQVARVVDAKDQAGAKHKVHKNIQKVPLKTDQYLPMRWREFTSSLAKPMLVTLPRDHMGKVQLLQSMISTLVGESIETEERLNVVCDEVSTVLSRIKGFPTASNGGNTIAYESSSDSLILAEVEDSEGIGQSFSCNPHECINLAKLKERAYRDGLDLYGKRKRFSIPCCGQYGHDANDCPMMEGEDLNGDKLGFL